MARSAEGGYVLPVEVQRPSVAAADRSQPAPVDVVSDHPLGDPQLARGLSEREVITSYLTSRRRGIHATPSPPGLAARPFHFRPSYARSMAVAPASQANLPAVLTGARICGSG